ncbi:MAG: twin-arginine translocation signal domain-containing protein [Opitutaceae bacterium]|jgi:hypothetical protein|nr:twin-arginine translocation signal domain-containing protein [Opitutaceae bacterium]
MSRPEPTRRRFLKTLAAAAALPALPLSAAEKSAKAARLPRGAVVPDKPPFPVLEGLRLTPPEGILREVAPFRALAGGKAPADARARLGCTHVSGQYWFTGKPFLTEGAERVRDLGFGGLKLWFTKADGTARGFREGDAAPGRNIGYLPNSDWKLPADWSLAQLARHPYYEAAFALPFSAFALEVYPVNANADARRAGFDVSPDSDWDAEERGIYELARHLLEAHRGREVTFILQNWEGDWMFRGGARKHWTAKNFGAAEVGLRADTMVNWFAARQRGVERARAAVAGSKCRVLHAVEVNKVFDSLAGLPTLCTHVLPRVRVDLLSWSCYDGMRTGDDSAEFSAVGIWQGVEILRHCAKTTTLTDARGRSQVMLGEVGVPEMRMLKRLGAEKARRATLAVLDGCHAAGFALGMPWMFYWELFCNELTDAAKAARAGTGVLAKATAEELNGFWLVRPDGTRSWAGEYLGGLLGRVG